MKTQDHKIAESNESWRTNHPITPEDKAVMTTIRAVVEPLKGKLQGASARGPFDGIMGRVPPPEEVTYEADTVGGVAGWWCRLASPRPGQAIVHLHGGWFNWGSAQAFRHLAGQIAARTGVDAFIPEYRLAPEHPFPAAIEDAQACYNGLLDRGIQRIALVGDSAGGCLALVLLSMTVAKASTGGVIPVGAVALSPVTDLSLTGASWESRATADPYFTQPQALGLVRAYLNNADPKNALASPLYGDLAGTPPVRVHVGEDEVLLDDSVRYVERAVSAGVEAKLDVWEGMPHGFASNVGKLAAANQALDAIGAFLAERLGKSRGGKVENSRF